MLHFHGLPVDGDSLAAEAAPVEQVELAVTGRSGRVINGGKGVVVVVVELVVVLVVMLVMEVLLTGWVATGEAAGSAPANVAALLSLCK